MKTLKGKTKNLTRSIIGKVTYKNFLFEKNKIIISKQSPFFTYGVKAIITNNENFKSQIPFINLDYIDLNEGDIVKINIDGTIQVLWEVESNHNGLYVTDYCNSKCIMCPQPFPDNPQNYYELSFQLLHLLKPKKVKSICITGGEPTLDIEELKKIITFCKNKFKAVPLLMLTNGKRFSDIQSLKQLTAINHKDIMFCVPLYSDNDFDHDYIVGTAKSFNQTIQGLYNLAKLHQKIEIRIVILKQNYKRLLNLAEYIYRNLPFVSHVAFMGMECTGLAEDNLKEVYIDPKKYMTELLDAVHHLKQRNMQVSIYNLPLCLLPKALWKYSRDSISTWKKFYIDVCNECIQKENCAGLFETSVIQSNNIIPLKI